MTELPPVTVVVVTWNRLERLKECIESLQSQEKTRREVRILVVDNASTDGTAAWLASTPGVTRLTLPKNGGFAGGMAAAMQIVTTPYVAMLNNDAVAEPDWLQHLLGPLDSDPRVSATTSRILLAGTGSPSPRLHSTGLQLDAGGRGSDRGYGEVDVGQFDGPDYRDVFGFCGGAAALRTAVVQKAGGFWADLFMYYEDVDLSIRIRRLGGSIQYAPMARVWHRHGASSGIGSQWFFRLNLRNRVAVTLANTRVSQWSAVLTQSTNREPNEAQWAVQPRPDLITKVLAAWGVVQLCPAIIRRRGAAAGPCPTSGRHNANRDPRAPGAG